MEKSTTARSSEAFVPKRASTVFGDTPAASAIDRIVAPDQPLDSKTAFAASRILSRVRAAAVALRGAR
jgi:hypothetical protein